MFSGVPSDEEILVPTAKKTKQMGKLMNPLSKIFVMSPFKTVETSSSSLINLGRATSSSSSSYLASNLWN